MGSVATDVGKASSVAKPADRAAFETVFAECFAPVARYVGRRADTDVVADVVSEVFLVAWRRWDELPADPLPWLYGVARRTIANQRRGQQRRDRLVERLDASAAQRGPTVSPGSAGDVDALVDLRTAFGRLSVDDREVLTLVAWEGLTARGVAETLHCGVSAATMRIRRARLRLEHLLEASDTEGTKR